MVINVRWRSAMDCRAMLPPVLLAGIILWRLPLNGALVFGFCLAGLLVHKNGSRYFLCFLQRCILFSLYWGLLTAASMAMTSEPCKEAFIAGFSSAGRIILVFLLGGCLYAYCSARQLALAVEWYLRPFFRYSSWHLGIALAVMLRLIPQMLRSLHLSWDSARLRLSTSCLPRKAACIAYVILRGIPMTSESIAYAVAARGMDNPKPWREVTPVPCRDWSASLGIILLELSLIWL